MVLIRLTETFSMDLLLNLFNEKLSRNPKMITVIKIFNILNLFFINYFKALINLSLRKPIYNSVVQRINISGAYG